MTDRDRWGLRGPIRRCRLQRTWYSRRCRADVCETEERSDTTVIEFREDGSLTRRSHQNADGSEWTSSCEYDDAGRLVAMTTENAAGILELQRYAYDDTGRLVRLVAQGQGGGDRIVETYEYDVTGGKKKTLYVDVTVQDSNVHYAAGVDGTDFAFSAPGAATVTTLYDARDQPTELLFHDSAGHVLSRVEFRHDEAGHLLEEAQTTFADMLPAEMLTEMNPAQVDTVRALLGVGGQAVRRQHRYDIRGHRIETSSSLFGLGRDIKTMSYNDRGDLIEEISETDDRGYNIDDHGQLIPSPTEENVVRSVARIQYDYDSRGNWTKKVVEARGHADEDFSPSCIEERTLTYDR